MSNKNEVKKLNDFFIRYFFGLKGDEDLLLSFINAIMIDSNFATFKSVEIINPFNLSEKAGFSQNFKFFFNHKINYNRIFLFVKAFNNFLCVANEKNIFCFKNYLYENSFISFERLFINS